MKRKSRTIMDHRYLSHTPMIDDLPIETSLYQKKTGKNHLLFSKIPNSHPIQVSKKHR